MASSLSKVTQNAITVSRIQSVSNVKALLRRINREVPGVITLFQLEKSPHQVREAVKDLFRVNKKVTDPRIIDLLVARGQLVFEETVLQHIGRTQLMDLLYPPKTAAFTQMKNNSYLEKFYKGL